MGQLRELGYTIEDLLGSLSFNPESIPESSNNQLLLGDIARTGTIAGKTATVKAGEDIRPAIESLKSAGGGSLYLLEGIHKPTYNVVVASNISVYGAGAGKTIIDFLSGGYQIVTETVTTDSTGTISISQGSKTVTGSGTSFTDFFTAAGETYLLIPQTGQWYAVASVASDTSLTLKDEYNGDTLSGYGLWEIGNPVRNVVIENLTVKDNGSGLDLISVDNTHRVIVRDCEIDNAANDGIDIRNSDEIEVSRCKFTENGNDGLYLLSCSLARVDSCLFMNNVDGVETNGTVDSLISSCQFQGNSFYDIETNSGGNITLSSIYSVNSSNGIYIGSPESIISNSIITDSVTYCLTLDSTNTVVNGCQFLFAGSYCILVSTDYGHNISGCVFDSFTTGDINGSLELSTVYGNFGLSGDEDSTIAYMKNTSGSTIARGSVVVLKSVAAADEVTTTTTQGDDAVFGVVVDALTFSNDSYRQVKTLGKTVRLTVDGTTDIAVGDFLCTSTTAGIAQKATTGDMCIAIALEAYSTDDQNGVIDALILSPRKI